MALTDIVLPSATVDAGSGQTFTVRGLCFDDLVFLMQTDPGGLATIIAEINAGGVPDQIIESHLTEIMAKVPGLPASVIACASDDTSEAAVAIARRLPLPVQIAALVKIIQLSFEPVGGVKKFQAQIIDALADEGITLPTMASLMAAARASTGSTG